MLYDNSFENISEWVNLNAQDTDNKYQVILDFVGLGVGHSVIILNGFSVTAR